MQSNNLPICIFIQIVDSDDIRRLGACKGWRNSSLALEKVVATSHVAIPSANQGKLMKAHKGQLFCAVNLCFESYSTLLSSQVGLHTPHSSTIALSFCRPLKESTNHWCLHWLQEQIDANIRNLISNICQKTGPAIAVRVHLLDLMVKTMLEVSASGKGRRLHMSTNRVFQIPDDTILNSSRNPYYSFNIHDKLRE